MHLIDTEIQVRHDCPFCEISETFPDVSMSHWCNGRREVLEIVSPSVEQLPGILKAAKRILPDLKEIARYGNSVLATRNCHCFDFRSVCAICDECSCWIIPPIHYYGGCETYRVMSPGRDALNMMMNKLKEIGSVKITSTRTAENLDTLHSLGTIPVHFFEGLTDRQLHALVSAFEKGLLDVPARTKMDEVAEEEGFSRSTYGEHLRKAVYRVVQNSYPILKLYDSKPAGSPKRQRRRVSK